MSPDHGKHRRTAPHRGRHSGPDPRVVLSPDETVDLGRNAWAFLAAGADQVETEISLFATADMLNEAIVAYLRHELAAGRSPFVPAHLTAAAVA